MSTNDVLKCPQEFLYIFASEQFLATLPAKVAKIIRAKKENQYYLLRNVVCGGDNNKMSQLSAQMSSKLKEAFGYSPLMILQKLKDGEEVAGKDWVSGVYGVGALRNGFAKGSPNLVVDPKTGTLYDTIAGEYASYVGYNTLYGKDGRVSGYTITMDDGSTYQTVREKDGKFYAGTYVDPSGQSYTASGNLMGLAGFRSVWSSIQGYLQLFSEIITFLKEMFPALFNRGTFLTARNTAPSNEDWNRKTTDWTTYAIFGGVAAALYYFFGKED